MVDWGNVPAETANALLEAALWYAKEMEWSVLPVHTPTGDGGCSCGDPTCGTNAGKHPRINGWEHKATTDEATIRVWWKRWPSANIGIHVGKSGLVVPDIDPRNGGDETWHDLKETHCIDDGTVTGLTGGGGTHLLYSANGIDPDTLKGKLGTGVDVKRGGGFIVVDPSLHASGNKYEWDIGYHPADRNPIRLPPVLMGLLKKDSGNGKHTAAPPVGDTIPSGDRNRTLTSLAGSMRRRGMSESEISAALLVVNENRCNPPLSNDEVEAIARSVARYKPSEPRLPKKMGQRLASKIAEQVTAVAPPLPDADLRQRITHALLETKPTAFGEKLLPELLRRRKAGELLLAWLREHGSFVQSEVSDLFYFWRERRQLYQLDTVRYAAWLYALTGVNPASKDYTYLFADCRTAALNAPIRKVVRVAAWDDAGQVLRVSRYDGTLYVLDGETITEEANGENALFYDDPLWEPYQVEFNTFDVHGALHWSTTELPHWTDENDGDMHGLAFRAWVLSTFFSELCPSRPLLVFLGEKGSGKSMALRVMLRLLFGPLAQVGGVPDKPDGFTAKASASHVLVLDNLDVFTGWLRDKLARVSTGADDYYRKLWTSNEAGRVVYRCWLAFTARTPDTLKRDDLADRVLLLPVSRIDDDERRKETDMMDDTMRQRASWWGEVLIAANQAVGSIKTGGLSSQSKLRMADWETLGRVFARNEGQENLWDAFCDNLQDAQSDFLLEDDLIVEGLEKWLDQKDPVDGSVKNQGREVTARELHAELGALLFGDKKSPPSDWPKSSVGFGRRVSTIKRELNRVFRVEWDKPTSGKNKCRTVYRFWSR